MILITGGAGYIGGHFTRYFLERFPSEQVVVVDHLEEGHPETLHAIGHPDRLDFYQADIGDTDKMEKIFKTYPIRAVVHFSAFAYVGESAENPLKYYENNVANSIRLFRTMERFGVRRIVFSSTCATYGNPVQTPMDETHPQNPINVYGETKRMVEKILHDLHLYQGWSCMPLRYFNAAGADESGLIGENHRVETHLIPLTLQAATGERPAIAIFGDDYDTPDGTCIRDYIHVNDLASAHCLALDYIENHPPVFEPVNLGTARGHSVREVIDLCREVSGRDFPVEIKARREGDPPILVADFAKAQQMLGWQPTRDLRQSIESAWRWELNQRSSSMPTPVRCEREAALPK